MQVDQDDLMIKEHEELVQLFIHEDKLAWNIIYFYIIANLGLVSAFVILITSQSILFPAAIIICIIGAGFGIIWFWVFQRSKIHWHSRLYRALKIEDKFNKKKNLEFKTFTSCENKIFFEKPPSCLDNKKGEYRLLKWNERRETLSYVDKLSALGAVIWICVALYIIFTHLNLF